jgi:hypothetical protein
MPGPSSAATARDAPPVDAEFERLFAEALSRRREHAVRPRRKPQVGASRG